jgi:hypothetical protein
LVLALCATLSAGIGGCQGQRVLTRPAAAVDISVRPEHFANAFRKLGRAHFRSVARFEAGVGEDPMDSVTTETDLWIDDQGNWRLVELNDKDGGREIVLHGREIAVALRYGKMIRRTAEDPEPQQILEEGLGGPFAAWDLLRTVSTVDDFGAESRSGRKVHVYKLTKSSRPARPTTALDAQDRRSWRQSLVADSIEGSAAIDDVTGIPLFADFRARYSMRRAAGASSSTLSPGPGGPEAPTETRLHGALDVRASIEDIGQSPAIARPEAEDVPPRQRTVPDEKALLGGLPRSAPVPVPALKIERGR